MLLVNAHFLCCNPHIENKALLMVQYIFDGEEHEITPSPHGNSRQKQAGGYIRTKPSILKRVKEVAETSAPRGTFHRVSEERGGYLGASAASDLPRNRTQAKNCRAKTKQITSIKKVDSCFSRSARGSN